MKTKFVIATKNLPTRVPIPSTVLYIFLLDYYEANGYWWGAVITILALMWIAVIINKVQETEIDLTENEPSQTKDATKSKFQTKLEEMAKERGMGK